MHLQIYAIYDMKAKAYLQPFYMHNGEMATRDFTNIVNDPQTRVGRNPEDYQMFHLGQFDDITGELSPQPPMLIASGAACLLPPDNVTPIDEGRKDAS